jgi:hypothetical protein
VNAPTAAIIDYPRITNAKETTYRWQRIHLRKTIRISQHLRYRNFDRWLNMHYWLFISTILAICETYFIIRWYHRVEEGMLYHKKEVIIYTYENIYSYHFDKNCLGLMRKYCFCKEIFSALFKREKYNT